jgi:hypothetical protein
MSTSPCPRTWGARWFGHQPRAAVRRRVRRLFSERADGRRPREHLTADDSQVTARVGIGPIGEGTKTWGYGLTVQLQIHLPSVPDRKIAEALVVRAHEICPYSNATRNTIPVELVVV